MSANDSDELSSVPVFGNYFVVGQKRQRFGHALGDEQAVERILVDRREARYPGGVPGADWQLEKAGLAQRTQESININPELSAPQTALDRYLPNACGAVVHLVAGIKQL